MGLPLQPLLLAVLVVFLGILAALSCAITKTVHPDGRVSRGFLGGLASSISLVFLCGLGLVGTGAYVATLVVGTAIDKNPIERIEIRRGLNGPENPAGFAFESSEDAVHVLFSMRGEGGAQLEGFLEDVFGLDRHDLDRILTVHEHEMLDGSLLELYELRLPLTGEDLDDFEDEVERELNGLRLRLPDSVAVYFEGARRL